MRFAAINALLCVVAALFVVSADAAVVPANSNNQKYTDKDKAIVDAWEKHFKGGGHLKPYNASQLDPLLFQQLPRLFEVEGAPDYLQQYSSPNNSTNGRLSRRDIVVGGDPTVSFVQLALNGVSATKKFERFVLPLTLVSGFLGFLSSLGGAVDPRQIFNSIRPYLDAYMDNVQQRNFERSYADFMKGVKAGVDDLRFQTAKARRMFILEQLHSYIDKNGAAFLLNKGDSVEMRAATLPMLVAIAGTHLAVVKDLFLYTNTAQELIDMGNRFAYQRSKYYYHYYNVLYTPFAALKTRSDAGVRYTTLPATGSPRCRASVVAVEFFDARRGQYKDVKHTCVNTCQARQDCHGWDAQYNQGAANIRQIAAMALYHSRMFANLLNVSPAAGLSQAAKARYRNLP